MGMGQVATGVYIVAMVQVSGADAGMYIVGMGHALGAATGVYIGGVGHVSVVATGLCIVGHRRHGAETAVDLATTDFVTEIGLESNH